MSMVTVVIPGKPFSWKRPENRKGGGRLTEKTHRRALRTVGLTVASTEGIKKLVCPVRVQLDFYFALKSGKGFKKTKPDLDNLIKLVLDACNGIAYVDDAQVVDLRAAKHCTGPARTVLKIGPV